MVHLFKDEERFKRALKKRHIYLFLDYDGTLAPIARTPAGAAMPDVLKDALSRLSKAGDVKIAVVSGRSLKDIKGRIGLKNIVYVGNHGFEIEGPKMRFESPVSVKYKTLLKSLKSRLKKNLARIKGVLIEDKDYSLSIHYRLVDKKHVPVLKALFHESTIRDEVRNNIATGTGKMLLEVRPPVDWDKGKAVSWLLDRQRSILKQRAHRIFPVYVGDDVTDEDAFKTLKDEGLTIFVGRPKKSLAKYYLNDTAEVNQLLKLILEEKRA